MSLLEQQKPGLQWLSHSKEKFRLTHDLWVALPVDPDLAVGSILPRLVGVIREDKLDLFEKEPELVDIYCEIVETTRDLVDPDLPCINTKTLPYDPIRYFGETGVAALIESVAAQDII